MPGARNPKITSFTVRVADEVNQRLEHLCDVTGSNKGAMGSILIAAGLNLLEPVFQIGTQKYVDAAVSQAAGDLLDKVQGDLHSAKQDIKQNT